MTYYDSIASGYDELHAEEQNRKLAFILDNMPAGFEPKKDDKLLDVGCGTGISTAFWNCKAVGIDPSEKLIGLAKKKYDGVRFEVGGAEKLPFKAREFDIVISLTAIQNFDNIETGLKEIRRVGQKRFILTFLKRSQKAKMIEHSIKRLFDVAASFEEDKDIIFFLH